MGMLSVTRLKLIKPWLVPRFLTELSPVVRELRVAPGYIAGRILGDSTGSMWTMTLWKTEDALRHYYKNGAHRAVMPKIVRYACEAAKSRAPYDRTDFPSWQFAHQVLTGPRTIFYDALESANENQRNRVIAQPGLPLIIWRIPAERKAALV